MRQNKNSFRSFRFPQLKFHLPAAAVAASLSAEPSGSTIAGFRHPWMG